MITSASAAAFAGDITSKPAFCAFGADDDPSRKPMMTVSTPLSLMFCACA